MGAMNIELTGHIERRQSIAKLPINLFAAVMGIAGLGLAWRSAGPLLGEAVSIIAEPAGLLALLVFIVLALGYGTKLLRHPSVVKGEFSHPIMGNFFATITIGMLLLSTVLMPYSTIAGTGFWIAGAAATVLLGYIVVGRLLRGRQEMTNAVPPWVIPGVASLDIPVTGAHLPFDWAFQVNIIGLAIGSVMAVALVVLIFARLIHQEPMPQAMTPALMVLVAPFEIGFLAYVNMTGHVDLFAGILFYFGLFIFLIMAPRVFRPSIAFTPSWWAISFPLAALSIAALKYAQAYDGLVLQVLALAILAFLTVVIVVLFIRTLALLVSGRLLQA